MLVALINLIFALFFLSVQTYPAMKLVVFKYTSANKDQIEEKEEFDFTDDWYLA